MQTFTAMSLEGRVPGELHATLTAAHTSYYREASGQLIEVWLLIVPMLQRFVETDRDFQTWRRRAQNWLGAGSATS